MTLEAEVGEALVPLVASLSICAVAFQALEPFEVLELLVLLLDLVEPPP